MPRAFLRASQSQDILTQAHSNRRICRGMRIVSGQPRREQLPRANSGATHVYLLCFLTPCSSSATPLVRVDHWFGHLCSLRSQLGEASVSLRFCMRFCAKNYRILSQNLNKNTNNLTFFAIYSIILIYIYIYI